MSSLLATAAAFYAARILAHFQEQGVLAALREGTTAAELATRRGYDAELLTGMLEYLWHETDVVERDGATYCIAPRYATDYSLEFAIDKYMRAHGPCFDDLEHNLRAPGLGRPAIRRDIEAAAYDRVQSPPNPVVVELVEANGITSLLDLGCGPATMLRQLARSTPEFTGWGIDANPHMCRAARKAARAEGVGDRVHILTGDARAIAKKMTAQQRASIQAIQTKGLLNELFRNGSNERAAAYLRELVRLFPGRVLFNVDYYGLLTRVARRDPAHTHTIVHDLVQLVTAQGVPPPDAQGWNDVYSEGGCLLEHAYEGDSQGIRWFVHVVRFEAG